MGAWGEGLLESDAALDGRSDALESFAPTKRAAFELAFVRVCEVDELSAEVIEKHRDTLTDDEHAALTADAPYARYRSPVAELLGMEESFGPRSSLLDRPEAAKALRALRDHIVTFIDEGWDPPVANNGPLALLLQLREVGCGTPPDLVTEWRETVERVLEGEEPDEPTRIVLSTLKVLAKVR